MHKHIHLMFLKLASSLNSCQQKILSNCPFSPLSLKGQTVAKLEFLRQPRAELSIQAFLGGDLRCGSQHQPSERGGVGWAWPGPGLGTKLISPAPSRL